MKFVATFAACAWLAGFAPLTSAATLPGEAAPSFALPSVEGRQVSLGDFKGKFVVIEWNNPNCPFVQKHYVSGNMQSLQKQFTGEKVVWLSINSTAASHPDYMKADQLAGWFKRSGGAPTAVLLDSSGEVARSFGARTTPHMYVVDPTGKVVYAGAIDDKRSARPADAKTAHNYVVAALTSALAGQQIANASTVPYGCSIKYQ
jgi:peroxiredoxin